MKLKLRPVAPLIPIPMLIALLPLGCGRERTQFQEAAQLHRNSISHIAAFSPFLQVPKDAPGAAYRYGARLARAEIVHHAATAQDQRAAPGQASTAASRIAQDLSGLLRRCAIAPTERDAEELRHIGECREELLRAGAALRREDVRATRLGLPPYTIPPLDQTAVTPDDRAAAAELGRRLRPPAAEIERQRLWEAPDVEIAVLERACTDALAQARGSVPGVADEIEQRCAPLHEGVLLLHQSAACTNGEGCVSRSVCGVLEVLSKRPELPARFRVRLQDGARRCVARLDAPEPEQVEVREELRQEPREEAQRVPASWSGRRERRRER